MRYEPIDPALFKNNRTRFISALPNNSIAIFHSNDQMPKNADQLMKFKQNSDLFHLCGIDQEETVLTILKRSKKIIENLYIRETNDTIKVWEGEKLTKEKATKISNINNVIWNKSFKDDIREVLKSKNIGSVYLNSNEHPRATIIVESRDARFKKWIQRHFPNKLYKKCADLLYKIRAVKNPQEINLIQKACNITHMGVNRVLKTLKPGRYEYEIEAEIIHEFLINKSSGFAYDPIIASGKNACILHYGDNNKICNDGDVVLMDFGAEYANYASDLTRCFPVGGRFTKRQKRVYNSVLRVMQQAQKLLRPGVILADYEKMVGEIMERELVELGLISIKEINTPNNYTPAYKKYYMHGTSHHLGLDVHDVSSPDNPLCEGMVLTCEPGIYIPEEGLGIRLENNILIGEKENTNLMENIPIEANEIEDLLSI
tara:strand:- start:163 stop:1452 length:1290 start_codon:yes stop_codon:yes gene_type:complete